MYSARSISRMLKQASLVHIPAAGTPSWCCDRSEAMTKQKGLKVAKSPSNFDLVVPQRPLVHASKRAMTNASRPFRVLGLQQVAVGAESKDDMRRIWQDMLGLHKHSEFRSEKENVDEDILVMGRGLGIVEVDIMAPVDVTKSPKVHTPNLNHIGLWIDDLEACVAWLKNNGVRFAGGVRPGAAGHKVAFIHPKGNQESPVGGAGVLIELVQAPADLIRSYDDTPAR